MILDNSTMKNMEDEDPPRKRIRETEGKDKESINDEKPLVDFHLDKLKSFKKTIKECWDWVRLVFVCFAGGAIMIGV